MSGSEEFPPKVTMPTPPTQDEKLQDDNYVLTKLKRAQTDLNRWIYLERWQYAEHKYNDKLRLKGVRELATDPHLEEYWWTHVGNYLGRVRTLGLDTLAGRQALGKTIVTLHALAEASMVAFGPFPELGVPSGELNDVPTE